MGPYRILRECAESGGAWTFGFLHMFVFIFCVFVFDAVNANPSSRDPTDDISWKIFPLHRSTTLKVDWWKSLSAVERTKWTKANTFFSGSNPFTDAMKVIDERPPVHVPVRVVIVDIHDSLSSTMRARYGRLERVMRAGFSENATNWDASAVRRGPGGVLAMFQVEFADGDMKDRLSSALDSTSDKVESAAEREYLKNVRWHGTNVIFMFVRGGAESATSCSQAHIGRERSVSVVCGIPKSAADLLSAAEDITQTVFVPVPKYFPTAAVAQLKIHVHPYTPNYSHRARWLSDFNWPEFEGVVRFIAPFSQNVGFFSTQVNSECESCATAFESPGTVLSDGGAKAARALTHPSMAGLPWTSWGHQASSTGEIEEAFSPEFDIYVVDVAGSSPETGPFGEVVEDSAPGAFPGIAIVATRSSKAIATSVLQGRLIGSVAEGAYGVPHFALFWNNTESPILRDVINRHFVCSLLNVRAREMKELLGHLETFGIKPDQVLDDDGKMDMVQRLHLFLYKWFRARDLLTDANHVSDAIYYAKSASHDIRALRKIFGLDVHGNPETSTVFRDPTMRCHFSRVKRGALLAGELLQRESSLLVRTLYPALAAILGFAGSRRLVVHGFGRGRRLKRH